MELQEGLLIGAWFKLLVKLEAQVFGLDILPDGRLVAVLHPVATPTATALVAARGWGAPPPR